VRLGMTYPGKVPACWRSGAACSVAPGPLGYRARVLAQLLMVAQSVLVDLNEELATCRPGAPCA